MLKDKLRKMVIVSSYKEHSFR